MNYSTCGILLIFREATLPQANPRHKHVFKPLRLQSPASLEETVMTYFVESLRQNESRSHTLRACVLSAARKTKLIKSKAVSKTLS